MARAVVVCVGPLTVCVGPLTVVCSVDTTVERTVVCCVETTVVCWFVSSLVSTVFSTHLSDHEIGKYGDKTCQEIVPGAVETTTVVTG